jgi:hypothetical protein
VKRIIFVGVILIAVISFVSCTHSHKYAAPTANTCDTTNLSYSKDIVPILTANCYPCHAGANPPSGLALDNIGVIQEYALTPNHKLSGMIQQKPGYLPMPQNGRMTDCNINKVVAWINAGAKNN